MEERKIQVFAGDSSGLIINKEGELYGFGKVFGWRIDNRFPEDNPFEKPLLLAKNVKHAALGGTGVLYVTQDGEAKMIGQSGYVKRFPGFAGAEKVFAYESDVYMIEAADGNLYGFGQNNRDSLTLYWNVRYDSKITPKVEKEVLRWDVLESELEWEKNNYEAWDAFDSDCRHTIRDYIDGLDAYKGLVEKYTKDNVTVYVDVKKQEVLSTRTEKKLFGKRVFENVKYTYEAWITVANNCIFEPMLYRGEELQKSDVFASGMYTQEGKEDVAAIPHVKKAVHVPRQYRMYAILDEQNCLHLYSGTEHVAQYMSGVADFSLFKDTILIAKQSGEILLGRGDVKKILSGKSNQQMYVNNTLAKE